MGKPLYTIPQRKLVRKIKDLESCDKVDKTRKINTHAQRSMFINIAKQKLGRKNEKRK